MSPEVLKIVREMFDEFKTYKQIAARLSELNLPVLKAYKINYEVTRLRKENYGSAKISLGDLSGWVKKHDQIPVDEIVAFAGGNSAILQRSMGSSES